MLFNLLIIVSFNLLKSSLIVLEKLNLNSPNSFVRSVSNLPNIYTVSLLFFLNNKIIFNIILILTIPITTYIILYLLSY